MHGSREDPRLSHVRHFTPEEANAEQREVNKKDKEVKEEEKKIQEQKEHIREIFSIAAHVIEIDQFVPRTEIDELYLGTPYYIVPDGKVGQQAFAVIREAIRKEGMVAIAKVVFTSREHVIALEARDKGLLGSTLRYPYELRKPEQYFDNIAEERIPKDMLELASHIVATKVGHFEPRTFEDHYENALKDLIRKKQSGEQIGHVERRERAKII